jgi:hypothetical protein
MTRSIIRKATVTVAALAILASSTVAMAQGAFRLFGGRTHTYTAYVMGGVPAAITINGDGDTDLDLYVYNRFGNLVAVDEDDTDYCVVRWVPASSGMVTIRVVNRGSVYNDYIVERWAGLFR